jgi:glycosyltransferase involved in cell wall biosynthesis
LQPVSRAIADAIINQAPQLRSKVRILPNPLPFRIVPESDTPRAQTILFVGRIHPEKGIEILLRALIYLPREILSSWKVKVVGPYETRLGGGGSSFFRTMQELGEQNGLKVEWLGPIFDQAQLMAQYRSALIFAYPSIAETGEALPLAPLEAMAHGCLPLVSSLRCFNDYIDDGITGFVFDHRGPRPEMNLAARLAYLLSLGRAEITKIGAVARVKAAEFALEPVANSYLDDFASLLARQDQ